MAGSEIQQLLDMVDQGYDHKSWHGTNLRGSLRGLTATQVVWRPEPGRHNIWELTLHAAYWKYVVWRRLTNAQHGSFPIKGSNWFERNEADDKAWRSDLALLGRMHRSVRDAVAALPAKQIYTKPAGSKVSNFALISGIAAHDFYHAGQIQLLKRLASK